jgi:hypothetical protein
MALKHKQLVVALTSQLLFLAVAFGVTAPAHVGAIEPPRQESNSIISGIKANGMAAATVKHLCGENAGDTHAVQTSIDIGCRNQGNPIVDMLFAIIRLLSYGVGMVIVGSIIVAGIQYTTSAGDPQAAAKAIGRIKATMIALGIFIFSYPILNYLLPSGFFSK